METFNPLVFLRDPKYKSLVRKLTLDKESIIRLQLELSTKDLCNQELDMLTYIYIYGPDAKEKFIENGKSVSSNSVQNLITSLRKKGLINGKGKDITLNNIVLLDSSIYYHLIIDKDEK